MLEGVPVSEDLIKDRLSVGSVTSAGYGRDAASLGGGRIKYQSRVVRNL